MNMIIITFIAFLLGWINCTMKKRYNYFKNMGVPWVPAKIFVGNMGSFILRLEHFSDIIKRLYNYNKSAKYIGVFDFVQPVFMIRDPELIKSVTIKNFDHFVDRSDSFNETGDPLFGGNLVALTGDKWRETRNLLSPAFTSSKMKGMFDLMIPCTENFTNYLADQVAKDPKYVIDTKDLFSKYTVDIIATCAFGISIDSFKHPKNEFYVLGKKAASFDGIDMLLKFVMVKVCPSLMRTLGIKFTNSRVMKFFTELVKTTVETRDAKGIVRPDMIQLMMDGRSKADSVTSNLKLDTVGMTAQAFVFFLGGFETTSSQMCILSHELVLNPDIQKRLQKEIDEVLRDTNGKPTYEAINAMPYLDAVFNESLRKHTLGFALDRICRKSFELPPALPGAEPATIKPGTRVWIPVSGLHADEKYHYNPDKFDPDRFLHKKLTISQTENLSFGIGPRSCIGNRFAILETKILFFHLLAKYTLVPNEKTTMNFEYNKKTFSVKPKGGFYLSVKPRS